MQVLKISIDVEVLCNIRQGISKYRFFILLCGVWEFRVHICNVDLFDNKMVPCRLIDKKIKLGLYPVFFLCSLLSTLPMYIMCGVAAPLSP